MVLLQMILIVWNFCLERADDTFAKNNAAAAADEALKATTAADEVVKAAAAAKSTAKAGTLGTGKVAAAAVVATTVAAAIGYFSTRKHPNLRRRRI